MTLTLCGNSACDPGFDPIVDFLWYIGTMLVLSVLPNWLLILIQPIRVPKTAKVAYILTLNGLFKSLGSVNTKTNFPQRYLFRLDNFGNIFGFFENKNE